jgi:L-asparaginase
MLARLRLEETTVRTIELMSKDSLHMTADDREKILDAVRAAGGADGNGHRPDGIVILHGTDTLAVTGDHLHGAIPAPAVPIVLTGAMRPYEMKRSDALQNLTEAIFATGVLPPGIYCVAHGATLKFPGVVKHLRRGTFVRAPS